MNGRPVHNERSIKVIKVMANNNAIYNAVIAGAGGANQERWISASDSAAYAAYRTAIEAVATAVDADIAPGTIGASQQALMQSICQGVFAGRYPQASSYAAIAASIVALYTQLAAGLEPDSTPGGAFDPIFQQLWVDTTKAAGGNGSIGTPYNAWADMIGALAFQTLGFPPWLVNLANTIDAVGVPIPDFGAGPHESGQIRFVGVTPSGVYSPGNIILSNLEVAAQSGSGSFALEFTDLVVVGLVLQAGTYTIVSQNSLLNGLSESGGSAFGFSNLIDSALNDVTLPTWDLRMSGGTIDANISVSSGILDDVEFLSSTQLRYAVSLQLYNCRFQAGAQLLCSANQPITMDLDTWGSMIAAGVTFPDTAPVITVIPPPARTLTIVPTLGTLGSGPAYTTFTVDSGTIPSLAGLEVGDSVSASMRNNHDADNYSLIQASVRTADSVDLTFLKLDVGTIDVGLVTVDLGIIESP